MKLNELDKRPLYILGIILLIGVGALLLQRHAKIDAERTILNEVSIQFNTLNTELERAVGPKFMGQVDKSCFEYSLEKFSLKYYKKCSLEINYDVEVSSLTEAEQISSAAGKTISASNLSNSNYISQKKELTCNNGVAKYPQNSTPTTVNIKIYCSKPSTVFHFKER